MRLGADIAADGGDEFTICHIVGDVVEHRHHSSGTANDNQVKADKNSLGHGAVGMLEVWGQNGGHDSVIFGVMVSESPERYGPGAPMRPFRKRDEMWLATRALLQPDPSTGIGRLRLRVDRETAASSPAPATITGGQSTDRQITGLPPGFGDGPEPPGDVRTRDNALT